MRTRTEMAQRVAPATAFLVDVELFLVYVMASRDGGDWRDVVARSREADSANTMCDEQAGQLVRMARALQASARDLAVSLGGSNRHASELLQRLVRHALAGLEPEDAGRVVGDGGRRELDKADELKELAETSGASNEDSGGDIGINLDEVVSGGDEATTERNSQLKEEARRYMREVAELEVFIDEQRHAHARAIDKANQDIIALDQLRTKAVAKAQRWRELYEGAIEALDAAKNMLGRTSKPDEKSSSPEDLPIKTLPMEEVCQPEAA